MSNRLSGIWYNELGSTMILTADATGCLSGKYKSAVGNAEDFYVLTGRYDTNAPSDKGVSLAWTVAYNNSLRNAHSTAGWSGQFFDDDDGEEKILTHWLLTTSSTSESVWKSTNVGTNIFTRNRPSTADIAKARAILAESATKSEKVAAESRRSGSRLARL
ncbi:hypothetical protein HYPSUDRAFT_173356 [Hypholoma sublateritium FD-334 SS-4]|uniref:Lipocalin-like domain-containing protein n=1 Tax=Hypholoma sublateritium (strain FD-334 SS-4) TaxID=945553 RepID=A0A0D2N5M8_HYPSF|nr:hypothetical protein HYPSUDRAFT_173356 [Hypholoma sublateritium FD-334 SS-4]